MEFFDYLEIKNLIYRYSIFTDRGDYDAVGQLFAHAKVYMPGEDQPATDSAASFAALWRKWNRIYTDTGTPKTQHLVTNVLVEPDGMVGAKAHSYFTVLQCTAAFPLQPICSGVYRDRFARIDNAWRFVERREEMGLMGDLSHHLTRGYSVAE